MKLQHVQKNEMALRKSPASLRKFQSTSQKMDEAKATVDMLKTSLFKKSEATLRWISYQVILQDTIMKLNDTKIKSLHLHNIHLNSKEIKGLEVKLHKCERAQTVVKECVDKVSQSRVGLTDIPEVKRETEALERISSHQLENAEHNGKAIENIIGYLNKYNSLTKKIEDQLTIYKKQFAEYTAPGLDAELSYTQLSSLKSSMEENTILVSGLSTIVDQLAEISTERSYSKLHRVKSWKELYQHVCVAVESLQTLTSLLAQFQRDVKSLQGELDSSFYLGDDRQEDTDKLINKLSSHVKECVRLKDKIHTFIVALNTKSMIPAIVAKQNVYKSLLDRLFVLESDLSTLRNIRAVVPQCIDVYTQMKRIQSELEGPIAIDLDEADSLQLKLGRLLEADFVRSVRQTRVKVTISCKSMPKAVSLLDFIQLLHNMGFGRVVEAFTLKIDATELQRRVDTYILEGTSESECDATIALIARSLEDTGALLEKCCRTLTSQTAPPECIHSIDTTKTKLESLETRLTKLHDDLEEFKTNLKSFVFLRNELEDFLKNNDTPDAEEVALAHCFIEYILHFSET